MQHVGAKAMTDFGPQIGFGEGVKFAEVAEALEALRAELAEKAKAKG
jgi:hypothetical protein